MNIIWYILGLLSGLGVKIAIDKYVEWTNEQRKTYLDMERILIDWKAIQKMTEIDNNLPDGNAVRRPVGQQ